MFAVSHVLFCVIALESLLTYLAQIINRIHYRVVSLGHSFITLMSCKETIHNDEGPVPALLNMEESPNSKY